MSFYKAEHVDYIVTYVYRKEFGKWRKYLRVIVVKVKDMEVMKNDGCRKNPL